MVLVLIREGVAVLQARYPLFNNECTPPSSNSGSVISTTVFRILLRQSDCCSDATASSSALAQPGANHLVYRFSDVLDGILLTAQDILRPFHRCFHRKINFDGLSLGYLRDLRRIGATIPRMFDRYHIFHRNSSGTL